MTAASLIIRGHDGKDVTAYSEDMIHAEELILLATELLANAKEITNKYQDVLAQKTVPHTAEQMIKYDRLLYEALPPLQEASKRIRERRKMLQDLLIGVGNAKQEV